VGHCDVLGVQRKGNALLLRVNWTHYSGSTRSRGSRVRSSPIERKDGNAIDDGEEPTAARRMPYRRS
jgi:hypothetical protein